jgi:hypothetical protein
MLKPFLDFNNPNFNSWFEKGWGGGEMKIGLTVNQHLPENHEGWIVSKL